MPNIYDEDGDKKMKEMSEKSKESFEHYVKFVNEIEHRYNVNSEDKLVRRFLSQLRRILWPESQFTKEPSLLEVIPAEAKETFGRLKTEDNYKKVVAYFEGLSKKMAQLKSEAKLEAKNAAPAA